MYKRQAQAESDYQPSALSPKGAIGVMQLMPGTARQLEADPKDLAQNIDAGTRLLRELLLKYQDTCLLYTSAGAKYPRFQ